MFLWWETYPTLENIYNIFIMTRYLAGMALGRPLNVIWSSNKTDKWDKRPHIHKNLSPSGCQWQRLLSTFKVRLIFSFFLYWKLSVILNIHFLWHFSPAFPLRLSKHPSLYYDQFMRKFWNFIINNSHFDKLCAHFSSFSHFYILIREGNNKIYKWSSMICLYYAHCSYSAINLPSKRCVCLLYVCCQVNYQVT